MKNLNQIFHKIKSKIHSVEHRNNVSLNLNAHFKSWGIIK